MLVVRVHETDTCVHTDWTLRNDGIQPDPTNWSLCPMPAGIAATAKTIKYNYLQICISFQIRIHITNDIGDTQIE